MNKIIEKLDAANLLLNQNSLKSAPLWIKHLCRLGWITPYFLERYTAYEHLKGLSDD